MQVRCDLLTDFLVEPFSYTIPYVDPDCAVKMVGDNNTQLCIWDWPEDNGSILPIVTSIVDTTIVSIINTAIAGLPDPSWQIREIWGCLEEPNGDGGPYSLNVTPIFHINAAAGWVKAVMKVSNPTLFCVVYRGQPADTTAGAQIPMRGGRSNLPLDGILPPPAEDVIDNVGEKSDDDGEMHRPHPTRFLMTKTGSLMFQWKLQKRIIRQLR